MRADDVLPYHRIHIVLEGGDYGMRNWKNVPRKGDFIMLGNYKKPCFFTAQVTQVTWGVAVDDSDTHWPTINLHCKRKKDLHSVHSS